MGVQLRTQMSSSSFSWSDSILNGDELSSSCSLMESLTANSFLGGITLTRLTSSGAKSTSCTDENVSWFDTSTGIIPNGWSMGPTWSHHRPSPWGATDISFLTKKSEPISTGLELSSFDTMKRALMIQCPIWMDNITGGYPLLRLDPSPAYSVGCSLRNVTPPWFLILSKYFEEIRLRCESVSISATT
jgi:hypothetical protein